MKKLIGTLAAGAILVGAAAPAAADTPPAGGCPTGWTLTAIADIPAVGQPGAYAIDQRGNDDGYVCLLPFHNPDHPGQPFNGIDNRVQRP